MIIENEVVGNTANWNESQMSAVSVKRFICILINDHQAENVYDNVMLIIDFVLLR
jgi:hypothetical protein